MDTDSRPVNKYKNRWYQDEAEFALYDYLKNEKGNPIVAMPTGTGKSVVIGNFIHNMFMRFPKIRVMMLTHVKKLIEQNAEKLVSIWPTAPMGVYSAGLKSRDKINQIIFGGVQSVAKEIRRCLPSNLGVLNHFGFRNLLIVDECHLISPTDTTTYQYVIAELKKINPNLRVIGFTATPYRQGQGMLTNGGIFDHICYDLTEKDQYNRLVLEGYLAPTTSKPSSVEIDTSKVKITGGDYNEKQLAVAAGDDKVVRAAISEAINLGYDRNHWLVYASGVDNAEKIARILNEYGVPASASHSKISEAENDKAIQDFESGKIRALVGMNKYTTGYDFPPIDMIIDLQPTVSVSKHVQKNRGTRVSHATGKVNCLYLDFSGNLRRLGPFNDPLLPRNKGKSSGNGVPPIKICAIEAGGCGTANHTLAKFCGGGKTKEEGKALGGCGKEFLFQQKISGFAFSGEAIRGGEPIIETYSVKKVLYHVHEKKDKPPSIKVSYICGLKHILEWVCLEHGGLAGKKARDWWRDRSETEPPSKTEEAISLVSTLKCPTRIKVWANIKYPRILECEY